MVDKAIVEETVVRIEKIYTAYPEPVLRAEIVQYLCSLPNPQALREVYRRVRESFSNQYGRAPDIKLFHDAYREYRDERRREVPLALPDPEDGLSDEQRAESKRYITFLANGMKQGRHPWEIAKEWKNKHEGEWI